MKALIKLFERAINDNNGRMIAHLMNRTNKAYDRHVISLFELQQVRLAVRVMTKGIK